MALNLNLIKLLCGSIYIQNSLILSDIFKIKKNQRFNSESLQSYMLYDFWSDKEIRIFYSYAFYLF